MNKMEELFKLVDGVEYKRDIPNEAKELAKNNNMIVIVGGSDDLMYVFGADSYLTSMEEHSYGWDGESFEKISDKELQNEALQLGLKIFWCGRILKKNSDAFSIEEIKKDTVFQIDNYDTKKSGAFSYSVNKDIKFKNFTVFEEADKKDVYCTGIIIELPDNFKKSN